MSIWWLIPAFVGLVGVLMLVGGIMAVFKAKLGSGLLRKIIDYSRERGIRVFSGDVMYDNQPMLDLLKGFGFTFGRSEEAGIVRCTLALL